MYRKIFLKVMGYHTLKYRIYILWPVFGHHLLYFSILFGSNARLLELWKKYFQFFCNFFSTIHIGGIHNITSILAIYPTLS